MLIDDNTYDNILLDNSSPPLGLYDVMISVKQMQSIITEFLFGKN